MKATVVEASNYPIPEDTLVPVRLDAVNYIEVPFVYKKGAKMGQEGVIQKWEWEFIAHDGEYAGLSLRGNSEPRITSADESSGFLKLARPWVEALLGRPLELGEEVDTDDLIGLRGQGTAHHVEPRPKKDGEGFWFNVELDELFPSAMGPGTPGPVDPWANTAAPVEYDKPPF